ncbi:hypothetical protein GJ744_009734 [Endocarpon pusillum]|uniref:3-hydroxyacyl-CoA dehydrogenase C-terminal domain-containing protein n=1 Tax=Endocarpon pusillum TaxID=364733 RepID=A0A8H7E9K9_9EURO|nr:hypothetical protein GJ744_009734 [Endocarpon pusillum]
MGLITTVSHGSSKRMVMDRIWAAVKREVLTVLAEGVSRPEEVDTLRGEMLSDSTVGPCAMMDAEGLDEVIVAIEDEYVEERHLERTFTPDFLRWKDIQEGRFGAGSPKGGLQTAGKSAQSLPGSPTRMESKISLQAGRIFWTNMGVTGCKDGSIMPANLDGSNIQYIIPKGYVHTRKQLAIDHINSHLYFSDHEGLCVSRCNFGGSDKNAQIQTSDPANPDHARGPLCFCIGVTVDASTSTLYWTQEGPSKAGKGRIFRANMTTRPNCTSSSPSTSSSSSPTSPNASTTKSSNARNPSGWTDRGEHPDGNSLNVSCVGRDGRPGNPALAVMPERNIPTRHLSA